VAAQTAKKATATIPIVFTSGADPVASGLVGSLSRPGANLTGASLMAPEMAVKRLKFNPDFVPHAPRFAMIINSDSPGADFVMAEVEAAGRLIGMQTQRLTATSEPDLDAAFATISQRRVDAVMVGADGFLIARRDQIAALAARYAVPSIYPFPDYAAA